MKNKSLSPLHVGLLGTFEMMVVYAVLLVLTTQDVYHPFNFFLTRWYLLTPLFLSFGVVMYMFQKLRLVIKENRLKMAGVSAGASTVAMAACCAHHLADFIPLLGITGAATVLTEYQDPLLILAIAMNLASSVFMMQRIKKHQRMACCPEPAHQSS